MKTLYSKSFPVLYKLTLNFIHLGLTQGINFILPIVIIPFLLHRLGIEKFGLVMTSQALMSFFVIGPDSSFNNTGTHDIAVQKDNPELLEKVFNEILSAKAVLLLAGFLLLSLLIFVIPGLRKEWVLMLLSFGMVLGRTILPSWFFMGVEKMNFLAYSNLLSKLVLTGVLILIITRPSDYIYVNLVYAVGDVLGSIFLYISITKDYSLKIKPAGRVAVWRQLKSGFSIFVSSLCINITVNSNIIILSSLTNSSVAGIYSIAEKIMVIGRQLAGLFHQATLPHVSKLSKESTRKMYRFLKMEFSFIFIFFLAMSLIQFWFAEEICLLVFRKNLPESIRIIRYLSFVPLIVALCGPPYQYLVVTGYHKKLMLISAITALLGIILNNVFIPVYSIVGVVVTIMTIEIFNTLSFYYSAFRKFRQNR